MSEPDCSQQAYSEERHDYESRRDTDEIERLCQRLADSEAIRRALAEDVRVVSESLAAALARLALAHQYASECGDCAGARVCPDDEPCTACADIWAVIDKAEGRA